MDSPVQTRTTVAADNVFIDNCMNNHLTFKRIMDFLRKPNSAVFRAQLIYRYAHRDIQERVEVQCKLEGLL